jgi:hypothetical protein
MAALNEIEDDLKTTAWYLSDIETLDLPWSEYELAGFSIEWVDIIGRVKHLMQNQLQLSDEQRQKFEVLKQRFEAIKDKLKALDLDNPFEG